MKFELVFTESSKQQIQTLMNEKDNIIFKTLSKVLALMKFNINHSSLCTYKYNEIKGPKGKDVFESRVQNNTSGAYRVFWHYGPGKGIITILHTVSHL